jgi:hypothetical protein
MEMEAEVIDRYAGKIIELKERESELAAVRKELEDELAANIATKEEGTDTEKTAIYKITVTSKLNRTLDYPAYLAIENDIPEGVRCVRMKPEIDLKKLRAMEMVRPGFSAQFVTSKPAKASVKVEVV